MQMRSLKQAAALAAALALLAGCTRHEAQTTAPAPRGADLETVVASAGEGGAERLFDGTVEAVQQAVLAAQTSGRIIALVRDVDDTVADGATIMRITDVEQRAGLRQASAAEAEASARYKRVSELLAKQLVSQADMDRATADRDATRAALAAAREQLSYTEVRAPFAGVVTKRYIEVGEAVAPGKPLASVAALGALRVNVDVPQALADEIRALQVARVYAGSRILPAAGLTVFPAAESGSNTVRVRIDLERSVQDLYPGMFVKAAFPSQQAAVLRVPASVVLRRSEVTGVYVVGADGSVNLRQVRLGRRLGDDFEVLAGLAEGEKVAADPVAATLAVEGR